MLAQLAQLADQGRPGSQANREYPELPVFQADPHQPVLRLAFPPANPAPRAHQDPPVTLDLQVMPDHQDLPVPREKTEKMDSPAQLDLQAPQVPRDLTDLLVTRVRTDPRKQSFPEMPDRLVITAPLARKVPLVHLVQMERQEPPERKDPVDHLDLPAKMANQAKRERRDRPDLLARRVSAPSTALWTVAFSSRTAPVSRQPQPCGPTSQTAYACEYRRGCGANGLPHWTTFIASLSPVYLLLLTNGLPWLATPLDNRKT